jgi:hypothetical protein
MECSSLWSDPQNGFLTNLSKKGQAYLGLGESEISPDKDDPGTSTPDKASVSLKIPGIWIHEIVFESSTNNAKHVGCVSCEANCFLPRCHRYHCHHVCK